VADRQLDLVALQVEHPGGRHELQLHVRVSALEGPELRDQPGRRERGRQGQAHHLAPGRAQQALGRRLDLAERRIDLIEVAPAGRCQPHPGRGPVEQGGMQKVLEPADLMADRRLGHRQMRRGLAEPPVRRGGVEGAQRGERRQRNFRLGHVPEPAGSMSGIQASRSRV
jgi:hypothetical protein